MANENEGVKVVLTPKKSEEFFHSALCNGMSELGYAGLELDYKESEYKKAQKSLDFKRARADYIVDNNSDMGAARRQVEDVFSRILSAAKASCG